MSHPLIDDKVRDAKNGERIQLQDGSSGTVMDHWFCHQNVDAAIYRKVVWIDLANLAEDDFLRLDPHVKNTLGASWYRTHITVDHFREDGVDFYEV